VLQAKNGLVLGMIAVGKFRVFIIGVSVCFIFDVPESDDVLRRGRLYPSPRRGFGNHDHMGLVYAEVSEWF
jgi:hypothetical protein